MGWRPEGERRKTEEGREEEGDGGKGEGEGIEVMFLVRLSG